MKILGLLILIALVLAWYYGYGEVFDVTRGVLLLFMAIVCQQAHNNANKRF